METDGANGIAVLKLEGGNRELLCDVMKEDFPRIVVSLRDRSAAASLQPGTQVALLEGRAGCQIARSGVVASVAESLVAVQIEPGLSNYCNRSGRMTDCQFPAMYRPRSGDGHFGGWRGAVITKHGPNSLHLKIEEGLVVPDESELMFSPIGTDMTAGSMLSGEEGGVMNVADVRSRRIRVRAMTRDVMPSEPGTVTLVVDISRTLYRAA